MRAAHAIASSREGSSSTVKPPLSGGAHEYPPAGERAIGRDEHRRDRFVDTAAEDIYAGGFCFVVTACASRPTASHSPSGTTIAALGNEIRYFAIELFL